MQVDLQLLYQVVLFCVCVCVFAVLCLLNLILASLSFIFLFIFCFITFYFIICAVILCVAYLAHSSHTNIPPSWVAGCTINHSAAVTIIKVFSSWHAVQLTRVLSCQRDEISECKTLVKSVFVQFLLYLPFSFLPLHMCFPFQFLRKFNIKISYFKLFYLMSVYPLTI